MYNDDTLGFHRKLRRRIKKRIRGVAKGGVKFARGRGITRMVRKVVGKGGKVAGRFGKRGFRGMIKRTVMFPVKVGAKTAKIPVKTSTNLVVRDNKFFGRPTVIRNRGSREREKQLRAEAAKGQTIYARAKVVKAAVVPTKNPFKNQLSDSQFRELTEKIGAKIVGSRVVPKQSPPVIIKVPQPLTKSEEIEEPKIVAKKEGLPMLAKLGIGAAVIGGGLLLLKS